MGCSQILLCRLRSSEDEKEQDRIKIGKRMKRLSEKCGSGFFGVRPCFAAFPVSLRNKHVEQAKPVKAAKNRRTPKSRNDQPGLPLRGGLSNLVGMGPQRLERSPRVGDPSRSPHPLPTPTLTRAW